MRASITTVIKPTKFTKRRGAYSVVLHFGAKTKRFAGDFCRIMSINFLREKFFCGFFNHILPKVNAKISNKNIKSIIFNIIKLG